MANTKRKQAIESIAVREFFEGYGNQLKLRLVTSNKTLSRSTIREKSVNRPALAVTGYFKYFANKRIQLFGAGEMAFFREQSDARRHLERRAAPPRARWAALQPLHRLAPAMVVPAVLRAAGRRSVAAEHSHVRSPDGT